MRHLVILTSGYAEAPSEPTVRGCRQRPRLSAGLIATRATAKKITMADSSDIAKMMADARFCAMTQTPFICRADNAAAMSIRSICVRPDTRVARWKIETRSEQLNA